MPYETYISREGPLSGPNEERIWRDKCDYENECDGDECKGLPDSCNMPACKHLMCDAHKFTGTIRGVEYEGICLFCQAEIEKFPMPGCPR